MDQKWKPYYRILEQTEPLSFIIWDQIVGSVKSTHISDLKLADRWLVEPKRKKRKMRRATVAESDEMETDEEPEEMSDGSTSG